MLALGSLGNESLFHQVYRNGRTLLSLKLGISGRWLSVTRVGFASSCSRVLCSVPLQHHLGRTAARLVALIITSSCNALLV